MKIKLLVCHGALVLASSSVIAAEKVCSLSMLVPQQSRVVLGKTEVSLGEPDSNDQATAWQGPLRSNNCSFDIGIIEQPIASTQGGLLFVSTYSGSTRSIALYDLNSCAVRWQSDTFDGQLALNSAELRMGNRSLPLDNECVPVDHRKGSSSPFKSGR